MLRNEGFDVPHSGILANRQRLPGRYLRRELGEYGCVHRVSIDVGHALAVETKSAAQCFGYRGLPQLLQYRLRHEATARACW